MKKPIGYTFEPGDYETLQGIVKALYGDGTHTGADTRRDLANLMNELLRRAIPMEESK